MAKKRRKKNVVAITIKPSEPTAERRRKASSGYIDVSFVPDIDNPNRTVKRVTFRDGTPADKYLAKDKIDLRQWAAGVEFSRRWGIAFRQAPTVVDLLQEVRCSSPQNTSAFSSEESLYRLLEKAKLLKDGRKLIYSAKLIWKVFVHHEPLAGGKDLKDLQDGLDRFADVAGL